MASCGAYGPGGMDIQWTQPDGSKLSLRVYGDEFYGRTETLDGYTVVFDPATMAYHYATLSRDGDEFQSTGKAVGKADPKALGLQKGLRINPASRAAKAQKSHQALEAVVKQQERWEAVKAASRKYETFKKEVGKREKAGKKGLVIPRGTLFPDSEIPAALSVASPAAGDGAVSNDAPASPAPPSFTLGGNVVGLTILVDFPDVPGTVVTQAQVDDYCNEPNYTGFSNAGSVFDYYFIQSGGNLRYNNNVTYYVRVPNPKSYYNVIPADLDDKNAGSCGRLLLNDALDVLVSAGYDFSKCTTKVVNGKNYIRACNVLFAGANSGVWSNGLWPHRSAIPAKPVGTDTYVHDYQITDIGATASLRIGTFCHENGHMLLGYPDLYSYDKNAAGVGNFSLMGGGNYGGSPSGTHPVHIDPYLKKASGWMDVVDLDGASRQRWTVQADGNHLYRYGNPSKATEYFLFELRDNTGYEGPYGGQGGSVNPSAGLVAYHVYETGSNTYSSIFTANNPNCSYTKPYELMVVEANQKTTINPWYDDPTPDTADAFKSSGKSGISDTTTPELKFWDATGRNTASGCEITSISADSSVMTFVAGAGALSGTPGIALSRYSINGYCDYGATAASQTFAICNAQGGTLNYEVSDDQSWLSCTPTTGSVTTGKNVITVDFATSGLAAGDYSATITVTDPAASPATMTISVGLTIAVPPVISLSTATIATKGTAGLSGPQTSFTIGNAGGGSMVYTVSGTQPWLSLSPASGTVVGETDTIHVNLDATSLAAGAYNDIITVTSGKAGNSPLAIAVTFTVQGSELVVTSPNGGEQWTKGDTRPITWSSNLNGNVNIGLLKGGLLDSTIIASTPDNGSFDWTIPETTAAATDYTVQITSVETPGKSDSSNATFCIAPTLADALDTSGLTWTTGGAANWFSQSTTTHDGIDAAQSGAMTDNQESRLEATLAGPGTLTFWWKVSSESQYDYLVFYLDGVEQAGSLAKIAGSVDWVLKTAAIPSGSHVVKWAYTKDFSVSSGSDAGWVDQVAFTPSAAPEIAVEQPVAIGLVDGAASIDCGIANLSSSASPVIFTVKNLGAADLTDLSLSVDGSHAADFMPGSLGATTLAPGASTTFTVTFSPSAGGVRTAAVHIASNDADENPFDIALTGTGVTVGTLVVTPAGDFASFGIYGGPFAPCSLIYTLSNLGTTSIDWTAAKTAAWLDLDVTSGTLAPNTSTQVTALINTSADALPIGGYSDTVGFANTTNGNGDATREVFLTVTPIPATVTLGDLDHTYDGSPQHASVTTNPPDLDYLITYDGSPYEGPASAPIHAGNYIVEATITSPNHAGSASGTLIIAKASQTIDFAALEPVFDDAAPFELTATASSGLPVSFTSSDPAVATVSGTTVSIAGVGATTITASQAGDLDHEAADSVPQHFTVVRANPLAVAGGPYDLLFGQSLLLDGSASEPSNGETVTAYEWDLNNDNVFGDVTGATPEAISYATFISTWGVGPGANTIQLKVTDTSLKTSITATTLTLITTLTWDANGGGAGQTNGPGAWLGNNLWWDGSSNLDWVSGSDAVFGGTGAGGNVTLSGPTAVNTLTLNSFAGNYVLGTSGQTITLNGSITANSGSGQTRILSPVFNNDTNLTVGGTAETPADRAISNVKIEDIISGDGGLVKNGPGSLWLTGANTYAGPTTVNEGILRNQDGNLSGMTSGLITLNGGVIEGYWTDTFTRSLGDGTNPNEIQLIDGASGFSEHGGTNLTIRLNNDAATPIQWGGTHFNPTVLVLQSINSNNNSTLTFDNALDLNGADRTVEVNRGNYSNVRAIISSPISNSSGTAAGFTKTGEGMLNLTSDSSAWDGATMVGAGVLDFGDININSNIGGGSGRNITVAEGAGVRFNALSNAILSRFVETTGEISVMSGTTSNDFDFSGGTGAKLPNAFLGNWAGNGAKMTYGGILTPASDNYRLGSKHSSGLLGMTEILAGAQGLIVGGTGASGIRVNLVAANTFTGDTMVNTGARLTLGNNLAIQNSVLDVGASGGNFSCAAGTNGGRIAGETEAASPTFGGLKGSRNLLSVFSSSSGNNETNLAATAVTGFTLNPGIAVSCTYSGSIGEFGTGTTLTKTGSGTQILSGVNTYTGATTVSYGTLGLGASGSIATSASVSIEAGAILDTSAQSNYALPGSQPFAFAIDPIGSGFAGMIMADGLDITNAAVWFGPVSTLDDPVYVLATYASLTGTGFDSIIGLPSGYTLDYNYNSEHKIALVSTGGGSAYDIWAATNAPTGNPDDDYDGDGVGNAVEFILGGLATTNDFDKLPAVTSSGGNMLFTFERDQDSIDTSVSVEIEVGTDLATFPDSYTVGADTAASDTGVTVSQGDPAAGTDTVTLSVTRSPDARKFARLKVVVSP